MALSILRLSRTYPSQLRGSFAEIIGAAARAAVCRRLIAFARIAFAIRGGRSWQSREMHWWNLMSPEINSRPAAVGRAFNTVEWSDVAVTIGQACRTVCLMAGEAPAGGWWATAPLRRLPPSCL